MHIISADQAIPFVHNAWETFADEDGLLHFTRFTPEQMARYRYDTGRLSNNNLYARAFASSNITLEMDTNSSVFGLNFRWRDCVDRRLAPFDLMVDGCLRNHCCITDENAKLLSFRLPEDGKIHRVQLFFPWGGEVLVESIVLSDGATANPVDKNYRILAFGDSITQGYIGIHPALNYTAAMTRELDAECLNQAIGGYYYEKGSLDAALSVWKPDILTVAYGTNDYAFRSSVEDIGAHAKAYYERLIEIFPNTPMLVVMPVYRDDERYHMRELTRDWSFDRTKKMLKQLCGEFKNITVLEDNFFPQHDDFLAQDKLHPNDLGFAYYSAAVVKAVREILQQE